MNHSISISQKPPESAPKRRGRPPKALSKDLEAPATFQPGTLSDETDTDSAPIVIYSNSSVRNKRKAGAPQVIGKIKRPRSSLPLPSTSQTPVINHSDNSIANLLVNAAPFIARSSRPWSFADIDQYVFVRLGAGGLCSYSSSLPVVDDVEPGYWWPARVRGSTRAHTLLSSKTSDCVQKYGAR